MKYRLKLALLGALLSMSSIAVGDIVAVNGATVWSTMITADTTYGGCMALLSTPVGSGCTGNWVTFSCTADFTDKDRAYRMLDTAQMAFSLSKRVNVQVDNTKKHNGFCFVTRIDVVN